jgi:2-haloalkanoic acid dehalogenase type II
MSAMTDFTALTFDCYGTLIDWERGILAELRPWADAHGVAAGDEALLEAFGVTEADCERETPDRLYPAILANVLTRLGSQWSVHVSDREAEEFGRSVGRWPAFSDSPAALGYLKQHYKLVIISNVDRVSFARSQQRLGVTFDRVITAEDVKSYKPSRRNFEYALEDIRRTLSVPPDKILHVAQSVFHDIVPAKSIGLHTMWINRRRGQGGWGATPAPPADLAAARPDFEVGSLEELAAHHRRLVSPAG